MRKCESCKKDVPEGAKFCPECGRIVGRADASGRGEKIKKPYATLGWTLGILFALMALFALLEGDLAASIPLTVAAAVLIPMARNAAFARTGIRVPGIVRFVVVASLFMWGSYMATPEVGEPEAVIAEGAESVPETGEAVSTVSVSAPPVAGPSEEELAAAAEKAEREAALQAAQERQKRIRSGFNARGEHWELRELIRRNLHDPKSYDHIETRYVDGGGSELEVVTRYRAKNAFGALVINTTLARVHIDGRVIEIVGSQ